MQNGELRLWVNAIMAFVLISGVSVRDYHTHLKFNKDVLHGDHPADSIDPIAKEYVRTIYSMVDAQKELSKNEIQELVIENKAIIDTKIKAWKRNADMINSLLGLPKGLNDAGR